MKLHPFTKMCSTLIDNGTCTADCCGIIPIPVQLWAEYKNIVDIEYGDYVVWKQLIVVPTPDDKCVFLDRDTHKCKVYDKRPSICATFGIAPDGLFMQCPYISALGDRRGRPSRRRLQRHIASRAIEYQIRMDQLMNVDKLIDEREKILEENQHTE